MPIPTRPSRSLRWAAVAALVVGVGVAGILAGTHFGHRDTTGVAVTQPAPTPAASDQSNASPNASPAARNTPATPPAKPKIAPPPEPLSQDYARNLQQSITSQVNSQVDKINAAVAERLRQTAEQASKYSQPCAEITHACKAAGFVNGGAPGTGIGKNCIAPIMDGTPQPPDATIPLPKVSPYLVTHCKAVDPTYGHFAKKHGAASTNEEYLPNPDLQ